MKQKSQDILKYLYRQKTENGLNEVSVVELPNTAGLDYLARNGYITTMERRAMNVAMTIIITGKGIDWIRNNNMDNRHKILKYYYDHRTEHSIFTDDLDQTLEINHDMLITEARFLVEKGLLEKIGKGTMSGDMFLRITAYGVDEVENNSNNSSIDLVEAIMKAQIKSEVSIISDVVSIKIRSEIYNYIKSFLNSNHYFTAVEESYKVVRDKLKEITGEEAAAAVFGENALNNKHWEKIFGNTPKNDTPEGNFMRGVGYIHLGVQYLRNEKTHTKATSLDKNLALHYISLASLAYDLISRIDSDSKES